MNVMSLKVISSSISPKLTCQDVSRHVEWKQENDFAYMLPRVWLPGSSLLCNYFKCDSLKSMRWGVDKAEHLLGYQEYISV